MRQESDMAEFDITGCDIARCDMSGYDMSGCDMNGNEETAGAGKAAERYPEADTVCGRVRGEERQGAAVFRGIPYGDCCSGSRRFQAPQPALKWEGIRDCTRNGCYAPQFGCSISGSRELGAYFSGGHPEKFGVDGEEQSEDCLVLDVVTPGCDDKKRPVVVYIHGGGFSAGSGTLVLGADKWAREEGLVVVGLNHRLNLFGYLYLGDLDESYADSGVAGAYYQAMQKAGQAAPVYSYVISSPSPHPGMEGQKYAWHTADLPLQMRIVLHPESEALSRKMAHTWAAFIRNGNPSAEDMEWKPFTQEEKWTMVIDEEWRMEKDPWGEKRTCMEEIEKRLGKR